MKTSCKFAVMLSAVLLVSAAMLFLGQKASAAGQGKITGTIKLDGAPPHQKAIDMAKEPSCQQQHEGHPITTETVVVGPNGGLRFVVLYISEGLSPAAAGAVSPQTPAWDQKGCQYIPHVMGLNPNQHFKVVNSDQTSHNIHPMPKPNGANNQWNKSQPPGTAPFDVTWAGEEVAIPVKCNIHPWMHGYMAVVKGPNAVSDGNGSFTIENVPPGNYTLTAWHETYGTQTQKLTVSASQSATANFTFQAK